MSEECQDEEIDYAIRGDDIVITRAPLAVHSLVYNVRDIVREMPSLLPETKKYSEEVYGEDIFEGLEAKDGLGLLVHMLANSVTLRSWEKIDIHNGARLVVLASPYNHSCIADILTALRRMSDAAVVMNARLYEVDRSFFNKHVAPLFAKTKEGKDPPAIVAIKAQLLQQIMQQKLLLESEDVKQRPNGKQTFLSRHSIVDPENWTTS